MPEPTATEIVRIDAPARDVWAYRLDFTNLSSYNDSVSDVVRIADGEGAGGVAGRGARYRFMLASSHGTYPVSLWVTEVEEGSLVAASMESGMSATETFVVRDLGDGRCEVTLSLWLAIADGLPDDIVRGLEEGGRAEIRGELDHIKANLEARGSRAP